MEGARMRRLLLMNWRLAMPPRNVVCMDLDDAAREVGARVIGTLHANVEHAAPTSRSSTTSRWPKGRGRW